MGEGAREPQRRGMERGKGLDEEGYGNCLPSDEKPPARMACVLCCHAMCPSRAACLHAHVSGGLSLPHSSPPFTSPSFSSHPSSFFPSSSFSSPTASPPLPSSPPLLLSALVISCSFPYPFPSPVSLPVSPLSLHPCPRLPTAFHPPPIYHPLSRPRSAPTSAPLPACFILYPRPSLLPPALHPTFP
ncbi:unnamed protein product [Closterium sp. NIES-65]|nr:unnamed protein product [Closterium sp. NIES-65]